MMDISALKKCVETADEFNRTVAILVSPFRKRIMEMAESCREGKGVPLEGEVLDSFLCNPSHSPSELTLLRSTWRRVAQRVHPDKGGSEEVFQMAQMAYKTGNLFLLNSIFQSVESGMSLPLQKFYSSYLQYIKANPFYPLVKRYRETGVPPERGEIENLLSRLQTKLKTPKNTLKTP
jgi:hypothetical protein